MQIGRVLASGGNPSHSAVIQRVPDQRHRTRAPRRPRSPLCREWIKTIPGKGWFFHFRIYYPGKLAFAGPWKPGTSSW